MLPSSVAQRPKWGWFASVHYWTRDALWDEFRAGIGRLIEAGILRPNALGIMSDLRPGQAPRIWTLGVLALWYETFFRSRSSDT